MMFQEPSLKLKRFGCQRNSGSTDRVSLAKLAMDSLMYSGALTMMVTLMKLKLTMAIMIHHPLPRLTIGPDGEVYCRLANQIAFP